MRRTIIASLAAAQYLVPWSASAESPNLWGETYPSSYFRNSFDCDELWFMRNSIYRDMGYCFTTDRAIRVFGNRGCHTSSPGFNRHQRANIEAISRAERAKGCPR